MSDTSTTTTVEDSNKSHVITNSGKFIDKAKLENVKDNDIDENLVESLKLLRDYAKEVALRYSAVTSDINMINLTITKILKELES